MAGAIEFESGGEDYRVYKEFKTYSLSELAELAQVSQGSIINFANKYGSGGFPTLKLEIAASLAQEQSSALSNIGEDEPLTSVFKSTLLF